MREQKSSKSEYRTLIEPFVSAINEWPDMAKLVEKSDIHFLPQIRGSPRNEIARAPELDTITLNRGLSSYTAPT